MALEIERKFLVKKAPISLQDFPHSEITQGYLNDPTTGKSIRVRHIDDSYKITRKKGTGLVREEIEGEISKEEFDQLRFQVENHFLKKTRYFVPRENLTLELDVYQDLEGLMTVEVEFGSKRDAKKFIAPERFGEELTTMRQASNAYIANHGLADELLQLIKN